MIEETQRIAAIAWLKDIGQPVSVIVDAITLATKIEALYAGGWAQFLKDTDNLRERTA